ncbi:MAG TPA: ATP-binding protein [Elusimicrobiota bacterium]|nr:ATP-binding protein [Elusimicrobiota bacterium]
MAQHIGADHVRAAESIPMAERYRLLIESAADYAIYVLDPKGVVASWNAGAQRLKGWSAEEIVGRNFSAFYPPEDVAAGKPELDLARAAREGAVRDESWRVRKDGSRFRASTVLTAMRSERGELLGFSKITRDLTERAKLTEKLVERTRALTEANADLDSFSSSVAHDLRAPIRQIAGFARLLAEDYSAVLDAEGRRRLSKIETGARHMGRLVDDLLALSRIGRQAVVREPVCLRALAGEVVEELSPEADGREVEWRIGDVFVARCDASLIRQVFGNLLSNALKYTRPRAPAVIEVGAETSPRGERVVFVRDNGVGFDMRYAPKLFGIFQRLHAQSEFEGTGVGLATVDRILRKHGGRIWAEAEPGHGATFRFTVEPPPAKEKP